MWDLPTAQTPYGLSAYGHAMVKTSPDSALIHASTTRSEQEPSDSFSKAKRAARTVAEFLRKSGVKDFGMSRIRLYQQSHWGDKPRPPVYEANVDFRITINALDRFEKIVLGVIEADANGGVYTEFRTSRLKEFRMQARRLAIDAAKEKATVYAEAAGVLLGRIINIQEIINPDFSGQQQVRIVPQLIDP